MKTWRHLGGRPKHLSIAAIALCWSLFIASSSKVSAATFAPSSEESALAFERGDATRPDFSKFERRIDATGRRVYVIDDMVFAADAVERDGAFTGQLWTNGIVYYQFGSDVLASNRQAWRNAAALWSSAAALTFIEGQGVGNYISVQNGEENSSHVGMQGGVIPNAQPMYILNWDQPVIAHEIGHALGLIHEHQRPDRNSYVTIFLSNVVPGEEDNFQATSAIITGAYDFDSLMHYRRNSFSSNGGNTIVPLPAYSTYLNTMGTRTQPSALDRSGMAQRYGVNAPSGVRGDFNGDSFADFVLFNPSIRRTAIWNLQNNALVGSAFGPTLPAGWTLAAVADVNRNGKPDYILYNAGTRQTAIWFLNNAAFVSSSFGPTLPSGWTLVTAGDFNGDAKPDYVLVNPSTRQTAIWFLNGAAFMGSAFGPTLPAGWNLIDAVDFSADNKPDFLLSNPTTRQTEIWHLDGTTGIFVWFGPTIPAGWVLQGAADFNNNHEPDYVLYQTSTHKTALWYVGGVIVNGYLTLSGSVFGPTLASGYTLASP